MKKIFYTNGFKENEYGQNPSFKKLLGMMWAVNNISGYGSFLWDHKKISIFELYQQHPECAAILVTQDTVPVRHCEMFMREHPEVKVIYVHDNRPSSAPQEVEDSINLADTPFMAESRLMFGKPQEYLTSEFAVFSTDTLSKQQVDWMNTIGGICNLRVYGKRPAYKLNNYCGVLLNSQMKDCMASVKNVVMFEPSLAPTVKSMGINAIVCPDHFKTLEELVAIVRAINGGLDVSTYPDWPYSRLEYSGETLDNTSVENYQNYVMQKII